MKKYLAIVLALALVLALAACGAKTEEPAAPADPADPAAPAEAVTIKIGASPTPHAVILEKAKELLAEQGITLDIVEFNDYVIPNTSLEEGELDANYFQHIAYLNSFNEEHGTHLVNAGAIHYEPFAIYPGKTASLDAIEDGAKIAVPNDSTNEARALMLLEKNGLITLNEGVGLAATKADIAENPHNFDIVEMEAQLLPAALADVAVAVINGNYALGAGLTSDLALAFEDTASSAANYVNVIAVKEGNEENEAIKALVEVLKSDEMKTFIKDTFGEAVVPAE